jgi:hypothetical protein
LILPVRVGLKRWGNPGSPDPLPGRLRGQAGLRPPQ